MEHAMRFSSQDTATLADAKDSARASRDCMIRHAIYSETHHNAFFHVISMPYIIRMKKRLSKNWEKPWVFRARKHDMHILLR